MDYLEDLLACLVMSHIEDSKLMKILLDLINKEVSGLKDQNSTEITQLKSDIEKAYLLLNERKNLTIQNNISIDTNANTKPSVHDHQENGEPKNWLAKLSNMLKHPAWLSFQGFLQSVAGYVILVGILLWLGWQQNAINYIQKQLPMQTPTASTVNKTLPGSIDSGSSGGYSRSKTR